MLEFLAPPDIDRSADRAHGGMANGELVTGGTTLKTHALAIGLIALAAASVRADSFDGNLETQPLQQAGCSGNSFQLKAADGKIGGFMENDGSNMSLSGKMKFDGDFTVDVGDDHIVLSGTVNGERFNFRWKGPCGGRPDTGKNKAQ